MCAHEQGLPALRAMRGQLKAQQHALMGLQEQLQGTAYPALEAAAAAASSNAQLPAPHEADLSAQTPLHGHHESSHHLMLGYGSDSLHHKEGSQGEVAPPNAAGVNEVSKAAAQQPAEGFPPAGLTQEAGPVRPASARQPEALRRSHEGLAMLVSEIGQHVAEVEPDPEQEARKRPRRAISAEGAKENRHR